MPGPAFYLSIQKGFLMAATATNTLQEVVVKAVQDAVKDASTRGWEAIVLVLVMLGMIILTGIIVRWLIRSMDLRMKEAKEREERMARRLDDLESFNQNTLLKIVDETSKVTTMVLEAVKSLTDSLNHRPCILDSSRQKEVVDQLAAGLVGGLTARGALHKPKAV
jgi:flagellar biosynthesis/type III secretory pathway M-ring protein FliF/YscJ